MEREFYDLCMIHIVKEDKIPSVGRFDYTPRTDNGSSLMDYK